MLESLVAGGEAGLLSGRGRAVRGRAGASEPQELLAGSHVSCWLGAHLVLIHSVWARSTRPGQTSPVLCRLHPSLPQLGRQGEGQ